MSKSDREDNLVNNPFQDIHHWTSDEYYRVGQWENWKNLLDICNAIRYGFDACRLPKPGEPINVQEAEKRIKQIEWEWQKEANKRDAGKKAPKFTELNINAKCYLHTILTRPEMNLLTRID